MLIVIGSNGQLGSEIIRAADGLGMGCVGLTHDDIDVTDNDSVLNLDNICHIGEYDSSGLTVINTAAYHDLQKCEDNPDLAWRVNMEGSANVARWCKSVGASYIYISTDYCNGTPTDASGLPLSVYAKSKLAGEIAALTICPDALVVRVGTLYGFAGPKGKPDRKNFIDVVVEKLLLGKTFTLPDYTSIIPTYAKDAAYRIVRNSGATGLWSAHDYTEPVSHYELGLIIAGYMGIANAPIQAVSIDPTDTIRPRNINYDAVCNLSLHLSTDSRDPIQEYLRQKGHIQ